MKRQKLTKIVATISDNRCDEAFIRSLYQAGMDVVRINTAHQTPEASVKIVETVRKVSPRLGILVDTKGPEVRTRNIPEPIPVVAGDTVTIPKVDNQRKGFDVSYANFVIEVPVGSKILIEDGTIELEVKNKANGMLLCEALNPGVIKERKNVNVPNVSLKVPSLSDKDVAYLQFAATYDIDFIAHSFVRNKEDVQEVRRLLDSFGSKAKIIAKIENNQGVTNLPEILDFADGIMIARGDLGVEIPAERIPGVQKAIINACIDKGKPVITATQMLHTMIENPRPTRAEVSDVANAVFDGTDAVMLSGETASGKYPLEAVETMARIAAQAESQKPYMEKETQATYNHVRLYLARVAAMSARRLPVKAIIADTETGSIARVIASYRSHVPVYAFSPNERTVRQLSLAYGIHSDILPHQESTEGLVRSSVKILLDKGFLEEDDLVVVIGGAPGLSNTTNFIEMNTAGACLKNGITER